MFWYCRADARTQNVDRLLPRLWAQHSWQPSARLASNPASEPEVIPVRQSFIQGEDPGGSFVVSEKPSWLKKESKVPGIRISGDRGRK